MSGPREWSPRGNFKEVIEKIIKAFKESGQSEAIAIGEMLRETMFEERENFTYDYAMSILEEFEDAVKYAKKELKKIGPR